MTEIHAIYGMLLGKEMYYIGSTVNIRRRWNEHMRATFRNHGPFGRYIHEHRLTEKIDLVILQEIKNFPGTRDDLIDELQRLEFLWKWALPARFGQFDGIRHQPIEVRRSIRNKQKRSTLMRRLQDPEYRARFLEKQRIIQKRMRGNWSSEKHDKRSDYMREFYRKKAQQEGKIRQERGCRRDLPFSLKRAMRSESRREKTRLEYEESGRVYKPRRTREIRLYEIYKDVLPHIGPVIASSFEFL